MRLLVVLIGVSAATPSAALSLAVTSDGRYVLAVVSTPPGCGPGGTPCTSIDSFQYPSAPGFWSVDYQETHQQTDIGALGMGGSGSADVSSTGYRQQSIFDVNFQVDEVAHYSFSGTVEAGGTSEAFSRLCFAGCAGSPITFDRAGQFGTGPSVSFAYEGLLQPGVIYRLNLGAAAYDEHASFVFTFALSPLPEPEVAALALCALVPLAALAGLRRRVAQHP